MASANPLFRSVFLILTMTFHGTECVIPYVVTSLGILQGTENQTASNEPYFAFRGIPFAKPPVGDLRWRRPEPFGSFQNVYPATGPKPACPQNYDVDVTSEDCLYLDIYLPRNVSGLYFSEADAMNAANNMESPSVANPLPVFIWVHGGGYANGHAMIYNGGRLAAQQNMVVVVIQYRLNLLGFLSSGQQALLGNFGLWDQRLAMLWVKDNIRAFGGDSSKITVGGESAGAASVGQHAISRHSAGIFQNVLQMSGSVVGDWVFNNEPKPVFEKFSNATGCWTATRNVEDIVDCMRNYSVEDLQAAAARAGVSFSPFADGDFFTDIAQNVLKDRDYLTSIGIFDLKFLSGIVNNEGTISYRALRGMYPQVRDTGHFPYTLVDSAIVQFALGFGVGPMYGDDLADAFNFQYFYPREEGKTLVSAKQIYDVFADISMTLPMQKFARYHLGITPDGNSAPATTSTLSTPTHYLYHFDYYPSFSQGTMFEGVPHFLDIYYLFDLATYDMTVYSYDGKLQGTVQPEDHQMSRAFGDIVGAFVRTGNPNSGIPDDLKGKWLPYDVTNETYYRMTLTPSIERHMYGKRASFWNDLLPKLHSRWLREEEEKRNKPDVTSSAPEPTKSTFTKFSLTEKEANEVMTALVAVCAILGVACFAMLCYITLCRKRGETRTFN